ncbi:hypothetical protein SAVIM40S_07840 [Streptomyces avidinii]|uniref:Uncharacterized protein n=1 Tax=Streptomyces avidinii TaxID=1895 RepID=A0ABS4KY42_STRAV|nr:hypothetical protein [Streptomyces avidinii]
MTTHLAGPGRTGLIQLRRGDTAEAAIGTMIRPRRLLGRRAPLPLCVEAARLVGGKLADAAREHPRTGMRFSPGVADKPVEPEPVAEISADTAVGPVASFGTRSASNGCART